MESVLCSVLPGQVLLQMWCARRHTTFHPLSSMSHIVTISWNHFPFSARDFIYGRPLPSIIPVILSLILSELWLLVVHIMQVKVHLRWRSKLIVMILLSIHLLRSQDHMCVQCVTNGFEIKDTWNVTKIYIMSERNCLSILCAANDLHDQIIFLDMAEFTVEGNCTNVQRVTRHLVSLEIWTNTWESTQEDLTTVVSVGRCLNVAMNWGVMFILTLVQSCFRVDTVRTVFHDFTILSHICWGRTMKVLGWHVTSVRRNLLAVITLNHT